MRWLLLCLCLLPLVGCKKKVSGPDRSDGTIPEVRVPTVPAGAITVDGRLDEGAWSKAGRTGPFVHPGTGKPVPGSPVRADARLLWSGSHLYVGMVVRDARPSSPFSRNAVDPHIWAKASGVELMLQPGDPGDNRQYYEIQVDVKEAVWDTRFDDYNRPRIRRGGRTEYGHQSWSSRLVRKVFVDRARRRYTVELALPWAALAEATKQRAGLSVPPKPGDVWRVNLYSFRDGQRASLSWSPILGEGNFHRTARFGRVRFARP